MTTSTRLAPPLLIPGLVASILLTACDSGSNGQPNPGGVDLDAAGSSEVYRIPTPEEAVAANQQQVPLSGFTPALGFALPERGSITSDTALVGGPGGIAFQAACPAGEVLAGVDGGSDERIVRLAALCVAVDETGRWSGTPSTSTGSLGGDGGTAFTHTCARDAAVTGLRASDRNGIVGSIELACARLDGARATQGDVTWLPRTGGTLPDTTSLTCPGGGVAVGLAGGAGGLIDRIALRCLESAGRAGRWSNPVDWPLIAIHAVNTPDGKLLSYGTGADGPQGAQFIYDVWDPTMGTGPASHATLENTLAVDLFCGAAMVMPDSGNVLMPGGDARPFGRINAGIQDATIFDVGSASLSRAADMGTARWYPTATTLPDGEILVTGGIDGGRNPAITPEIYSPADNTWRSLFGASMLDKNWFYPRQWVAPGGRVFGLSGRQMYFMTTDGGGSIEDAGTLPPTSFGHTVAAAMYRPGKILQVGGQGNSAGRGAVVIDIGGDTPGARPTAPMAESRIAWAEMVVLPDGTVMVSGGSPRNNMAERASLRPELWNPDTGTWSTLSSHRWPRLYHSTSLLLQDGRVLLAGGGAPGPFLNLNAEVFSPPYLFDDDDAPRRRPVIASAPERGAYAERIDVGYDHPSDIARVTLLKSGAVTHSNNMEQSFLELAFATSPGAGGETAVQVTLPASADVATPGHYMLFLLDATGTPSPGHRVKLGTERSIAPVVPTAPPDRTEVDANLIVNGGFESGLANWQSCGPASAVSAGSKASTGAQALDASEGACLYQEFSISPGTRYDVQCDARSQPTVYASMSLVAQDETFTQLDSASSVVRTDRYGSVAASVLAPDTAAIGALTLYAEGPAGFDSCIVTLADDAGVVPGTQGAPLQPAPVPADRELLRNGDFEAGARQWDHCADPALSRAIDDVQGAALEITGAGCLYQEFATRPGESYRLRCQARSEGSRYTSISLQVTDEQYTNLAADSLPVGENSFQAYTLDLTAPAGSALGAVTLYSEDVGVFDECSVERR